MSTFSSASILGTISIGEYIVNDFVITIAEVDHGYTLTIRKGSDVQTASLKSLTASEVEALLDVISLADDVAAAKAAALGYANNAAQSASSAMGYASAASGSASAAASSASTATDKAAEAAGKASDAESSASAAALSAEAADDSATAASSSASDAADSASDAADVKDYIDENYASMAETIDEHDDAIEALSSDLSALQGYVRSMSPLLSAGPAALLSIQDAAPLDAEAAVVAIAPSQNLHGYANPWPAGGGKNLLPDTMTSPTTASGVTFTRNDKGEIAYSGTTSSSDFSVLVGSATLEAGSYVLSGAVSSTARLRLSKTSGDALIGHDSGSGYSFTLSEATQVNVNMRLSPSSGTAVSGTFKPMIRLSTVTDATFAPYSNICPITGWTGANVQHRGTNLVDDTIRSMNVAETTLFIGSDGSYTIPLKAGTYTLSIDFLNGAHYSAYIREQNDSANTTLWTGTSTATSATFTLQSDGMYRLWVYSSSGVTAANIGHVQLEAGSVATPYGPYQGDTYTVTFPSSAGTVYGGTLDLVAGKLTVDKAMQTLNGTETYTMGTASTFRYFDAGNEYAVDTTAWESNVISNWLKANASGVSGYRTQYNSKKCPRIVVPLDDTQFTSVEALTAKLAETPLTIVYPLATPVVYTLDPVTLTMLRGANTLWADCGDMSVSYRADLPTYIDERTRATRSMIAGIEAGMTATKAYSAGDLLIVGDTLYKAAASIANGATLTPGTNVTATTVAEQLILLANA